MIDWDIVLGPCMATFGEPVRFTNAAGQAFELAGIFDEAYREVDLAGGIAVTAESPVLGIQVSTFPSLPAQYERIFVYSRAKTYVIRETQIDGHGGAKLLLNDA